jgi:hypothetical protein
MREVKLDWQDEESLRKLQSAQKPCDLDQDFATLTLRAQMTWT